MKKFDLTVFRTEMEPVSITLSCGDNQKAIKSAEKKLREHDGYKAVLTDDQGEEVAQLTIEGVEPPPKDVKREEVEKQEKRESLITLAQIADKLGRSPKALRKKLRDKGFKKPGTRWEWPEDSEDLKAILSLEDEKDDLKEAH